MYRHQRRLSDPSANINNFVRGGWKSKLDMKSRSENEGLDCLDNGVSEIEAGDVRDGMYSSTFSPRFQIDWRHTLLLGFRNLVSTLPSFETVPQNRLVLDSQMQEAGLGTLKSLSESLCVLYVGSTYKHWSRNIYDSNVLFWL